MKKYFLFVLATLLLNSLAFAQEEDPEVEEITSDTTKTASDSVRTTFQFFNGAPVTIDLEIKEGEEEEEEESEKKEEKKKKNVFYDLKTRKGYTKNGYGNRVTEELFHYLREPSKPNAYVRDFFWFDTRRREVRNNKNPNPKFSQILHGPYTKKVDGEVVVEGMYYKGLKHGRWLYKSKDGILLNKEIYFKGWPKESEITYYDEERTRVKEAIPIEFGEKEGTYLLFHENGQVAVQGEYRFDHKVGLWVEYYDLRRRRKKTIQYGKDPFDEEFDPFINQEWNSEGKLVYDRERWEQKFGG
jgi:antitoxin component YwqK of YwqJK toxin-antitoxin module